MKPVVYRTVVDGVITTMRPEMLDVGIPEDIISALQSVSLRLVSSLPSTVLLIKHRKYDYTFPCAATLIASTEMGAQDLEFQRRRL